MILNSPYISGSLTVTGATVLSGSVTLASGASIAGTASLATTALTASSVANLNQNVQVTGSLTVSSAITAQTLVVQQVTSSIVYSSGSNIFGNQLTNTQQFTGSLQVTSSNASYFLGGNVGIGTVSPLSKLHVNTGTNQNFRVRPGTDVGATNGVALNSRTDDDGSLQQLTLRASDVIMLPSGNVGINTSSPLSTLDVSSTTPTITIRNSSQKNWNSGDQIGYLDQYIDDTSSAGARTVSYLRSVVSSGVSSGITVASDLIFGTANYDASATEKMRITNSGNVGIGTSSPARIIHTYGTGAGAEWILEDSASSANVKKFNVLVSGGLTQFRALNDANNGGTVWLTANNSTGNVGIGTPTPTFRFEVLGSTSNIASLGTTSSGGGYLQIKYNTTSINGYLGAGNQLISGGSVADMALTSDAGNIIFGTSAGTERMRIDTSGRVTMNSPSTYVLTVSNTTNTSGQGVFVTSLGSSNNNTTSYHYIAATGGADKYYLYGNGTYTTVSDARLKKNITTVTDNYLGKVKGLRIVNYNWNDQEDGTPLEFGMIAQEVEELIPGIVHEGREHEDGIKYKGIQASVLPYILIKAMQEQQTLIESLKARIEVLESK
jgi:hypothetical protein